jgi:hypothetical protein
MAAPKSHRARWALALAALTLTVIGAGAAMLRMNAEPASPVQPRIPAAAPAPALAPAPAPALAPAPAPAPAPDRDAALPNEAALLREIEDSVRGGRIGHARSLADQFFRAFPGSPAIERIERVTGYHPRPYQPLPR